MPPEDVTLGEVNRNLAGLSKDVRSLAGTVGELSTRSAVTGEKIGRLERIVYGSLATGLTALGTAVLTAVTSRKGS